RLDKMLAGNRCRLTTFGCLPVTMFENYFRRAFHQDSLHAAAILMERGHKLVLRFEWDGVDARIRVLLSPPLQPELVAKRVQRSFGWISLNFPNATVLPYLRVVAKHGNLPHELEHGIIARQLTVLKDLALG